MELFYIRHKPTGRYYKGGCFNCWIYTTKNQKPLTLKQVINFYKYAVRDGVVKMRYNYNNRSASYEQIRNTNVMTCKENDFEVIDVFTNQVVDYKKFK